MYQRQTTCSTDQRASLSLQSNVLSSLFGAGAITSCKTSVFLVSLLLELKGRDGNHSIGHLTQCMSKLLVRKGPHYSRNLTSMISMLSLLAATPYLVFIFTGQPQAGVCRFNCEFKIQPRIVETIRQSPVSGVRRVMPACLGSF